MFQKKTQHNTRNKHKNKMISKPNDRRFLSFPSVHPCESISQSPLMSSLISLSRKISNFEPQSFSTQKRNTQFAIRVIAILSILFEEIHDRKLILSESTVLCFSDFHSTFQKVLFLLQDCSRDGSRIWVLMRSHFISNQFRVLIREIATVLDVLALDSIDVCIEVKEFIQLISKQTRKSRIEIDVVDEEMNDTILSILSQFEEKIEPESKTIKRVLDYIGVKNWSDFNLEIKFLKSEIDFQYSNSEEQRHLQLLSGLLGFMCYCRGVIHEKGDYQNKIKFKTEVGFNSNHILKNLNPEDFLCPISLELMTDPVIISTGQTYDRPSIQKWLNSGNALCPKTRVSLNSTDVILIPNTALSNIIHQFCIGYGVSVFRNQTHDISRTAVPLSPAAAESIRFLSKFITRKLVFGSREEKNKAAYESRLLAKSNIFNRFCLVESGVVLPLLNLLSSREISKSTQENSMAALLKLSKHSIGKSEIVENGGINQIIEVLVHGLSMESKQTAAALIFYLSSVKEYRKLISDLHGSIHGLIELMKYGSNCGKKNAVVAIFGLLFYQPTRNKFIKAGLIPVLVKLLADTDRTELITDTVAVLAAISENVEGSFAVLESSGLAILIKMIKFSSSIAAKEYCVSTLLSLCGNCGGDEVLGFVNKDSSAMAALYSLVSQGTSSSSKKATLLIGFIQNFQETNSSIKIH